MKRWILIGALLVGPACKKKDEASPQVKPEEAVNNPATRYVDDLRNDTNRARIAAEAANQRNAELEAEDKILKDQQ